MKRNRIRLILLSLLVLTSIVGIFSMNGLSQPTDLNYTFQNDNLYNSTSPSYISGRNYRDYSEYTGHYNATYSFENEVGLSGTDIDFVDSKTGTDILNVTNSVNNHDDVLRFFDDSPSSINMFDEFAESPVVGTYEFWHLTNDSAKSFTLSLRSVGSLAIYLAVRFGTYQYYAGGWIGTYTVADNVWYHHRIDFNCSSDTFDWYINGILEIDDGAFREVVDDVNRWNIFTSTVDSGYLNYLDAIGYSWDDNYSVGDNFIPYVNSTLNKYEVDKYEFAFASWENLYTVGTSVFSNWTEIDTGDKVQIATNPLDNADRRISVIHNAPDGNDLGIEKDFFIPSGIVNVSWSVEFDDVGSLSEFRTKVYSYDKTLIANIFIENGFLKDGGDWLTGSVFTTGEIYEFFLYINYNDGFRQLRYFTDGVYQRTFNKTVDSSKDGLGEIEFFIDANIGDDMELFLDYVGAYINGSSISEEFGHRKIRWITLSEPSLNWDFEEFNLFSFDVIGNNLSFWVAEPTYIMAISTIENLVDWDSFNISQTFNQYDLTFDGAHFIYIPYVWIGFYNDVLFNSMDIDGVKLIQGSNEYGIDFTHGNVDIDESYFYVDSSNRLRGICHYNDSDLEYIQANFNIENVLNENRSLRFRTSFSGQYGFFSLSYIDLTSSSIELPISTTSHNIILPQEKTIDEFVFLITDDDDLNAGYGSGYIQDIELIWNPSISITIVTIALIMVIIPIIIMIVPTLTLYSRYGKSVIMPVFIFMAIICFAGGLIPAWLFFILMIGAGGFLVLKKGSDE